MLSMLLLASCGGDETVTKPTATANEAMTAAPSPSPVGRSIDNREPRQELSDFIAKQLTGPYGLYTNLLDTDESGEAATGHEVLSESASLLMRAAVLAGDK